MLYIFAASWYQSIHWHTSRKVAGTSVTSLSLISAISRRLRRRTGFCSCDAMSLALPGMAGYPVLHAEKAVLEPVIEFLRLIVAVDRTIVADLVEQPAPSEREPYGHILAEMLNRADTMMELVCVLCLVQMRIVEIGIPGRLTIGKKTGHISARERTDRIDIGRMEVQEERGNSLRRPVPRRSRHRGDRFSGRSC